MTPQEVADLLGVSAQTIKNWEEAGILKSFKGGLRSKFFSKAYIEKFMSELDNLNKGERKLKEQIVAINKKQKEYHYFMQDLCNRDPYSISRLASVLSQLLLFTTELYNEELSDVDKKIIERIAGLKTSYEISQEFGCCTQRIHQLYKTVEKHITELQSMQSMYLEIKAENERLKEENRLLLDKIVAGNNDEQVEKTSIVDIMATPIEHFGFSNRLLHIFEKYKVKVMYDLVNLDPRKLWIARNFGAKCAKEIEMVLDKYGLKFNNAPQGVYTKFGTKEFRDNV